MEYKWEFVEIEQVCHRVNVGFVGTCHKYYTDSSGVKMIRTTNLGDFEIDESDLKYVTEDFHEKNKKSQIKKNDILVARHGENGKAVRYDSDEPANTLNIVILTPNSKIINPKYLELVFNSFIVKEQINQSLVGSVQSVVNTKTIAKLKIPLPTLEEQEIFVRILGSLTEKIALNKNTTKLLNTLSEVLIKRWFIDFEFPNDMGLPYRSSCGEMVESEIGEIPKGWSIYCLGDFATSISKSINKKTTEYARFLNTSDILEGNIEKVEISLTKDMPGQAKKLIEKGDILYSEIRPKNKRYAYVDFDSEEYVVSTKLMVIRIDENIYSSKLLYLWLTHSETINTLQQIAEDRSGTFPQITFSILSKFKFAIPCREKLKELESLFIPLLDKILALKKENEKLVELRDSLLPKLLSGEIEIPDESVVEL